MPRIEPTAAATILHHGISAIENTCHTYYGAIARVIIWKARRHGDKTRFDMR